MADDTGIVPPPLEDELAEAAFREVFPNGLPSGQKRAGSAILSHYMLEERHLLMLASHAEANVPLEGAVHRNPLQAIRNSHHKLARLLASGERDYIAAAMCNYSITTVNYLKADPAFQELLALYEQQVQEIFIDRNELMADIHTDVLGEIQRRLTETPEQFTPAALTELHKSLADRSGHGPSSNVNANLNILSLSGADIARIKAQQRVTGEDGRQERVIEGSARALSEEDRRALVGQTQSAAFDTASLARPEGQQQGGGDALRGEGDPLAAVADPVIELALPQLD